METLDQPKQLPFGEIKLEDYLPDFFLDRTLKAASDASIESFTKAHGALPLKYQIERFCFERDDQIATIDSRDKVFAWASGDTKLTNDIFARVSKKDLPLVLRSHPLQDVMASPVHHIHDFKEVEQFLAEQSGAIQQNFFEKLDVKSTVVQLIKNPYHQDGLFLVRPTFIADPALRTDLANRLLAKSRGPQWNNASFCALPGDTANLFCMRIMVIDKTAREKKDRTSALFLFDPESNAFTPIDGFPWEIKAMGMYGDEGHDITDWAGREHSINTKGTKIITPQGTKTSPDHSFLNPGDLGFLDGVLTWQLPRVVGFQKEISAQPWIPNKDATVHQFVVVPPQDSNRPEINTAYFDFRPHASSDLTISDVERLIL